MAEKYLQNPDASCGAEYVATALRKLRVKTEVYFDDRDSIPINEPHIFVANHPCGFIDGLVALSVIFSIRSDVKAIANQLILSITSPNVHEFLIPIRRRGHRNQPLDIKGMKEIQTHLRGGRSLLVFPGGWVASSSNNGRVKDHAWDPTVGHMILKYRTQVTPIFIGGKNSRLFYAARRTKMRLGSLLLLRELSKKKGSTVEVAIGKTIPYSEMEILDDNTKITQLLQTRTYQLSERTR